jgi:hypothetical protein
MTQFIELSKSKISDTEVRNAKETQQSGNTTYSSWEVETIYVITMELKRNLEQSEGHLPRVGWNWRQFKMQCLLSAQTLNVGAQRQLAVHLTFLWLERWEKEQKRQRERTKRERGVVTLERKNNRSLVGNSALFERERTVGLFAPKAVQRQSTV